MWQQQGAELIHVVDLDGALSGTPQNIHLLSQMASAISVPIQFGGGLRDLTAMEKALSSGAFRVVVGTSVIENQQMLKEALSLYGEKVAVAIDARKGKVALRGWQETSEMEALELARRVEDMGARRIIYTDIQRDGTLQGPNFKAIAAMAQRLSIPFIASGGVTSLKDIERLCDLRARSLEGVIVGKAFYSGDLDLREAMALAQGRGGHGL